MKFRIVAAVFTVAAVSVLLSGTVSAESPLWFGGEQPVIVERTPTVLKTSTPCPGVWQEIEVIGFGRQAGCLFGTHPKVFRYYGDSGMRMAASLTADSLFYPVRGFCENTDCLYNPEMDFAVSRVYTSAHSLGLIVSRTFTRQLSWHIDPQTLQGYYRYDGMPEKMLRLDSGQFAAVGKYGVSQNGKWIIAELIDKGTALIEIDTGKERRIIASGYQYGRGMDPSQHLTVSNDGRTGVVVGENTGFTLVSIPEQCGESLGNLSDPFLHPSTLQCPYGDIGIGTSFPGFQAALHPEFNGDNTVLSLVVQSRQAGLERAVFRPGAYKNEPVKKYIALGDSFTSGEGETDDQLYEAASGACHVSKRSYPYLVGAEKIFSPGLVINAACSGARIPDLIKQSVLVDTSRPEFVTIGVGGNDSGLIDKLRTCAMPGTCEWVTPELRVAVAEEMSRLYAPLVGLYGSMLEKHPSITLYAVGYPLATSEGACGGLTGILLSAEERVFMNQSVRYINSVIRSAAKTAGIFYADMETAFATHRLCENSISPAMNGLRFGGDIGLFENLPVLNFIGSETFHPTPYGHQLMTERLLAEPDLFTQPCRCAEETQPIFDTYWQGTTGARYLHATRELVIQKPDTSLDVKLQPGSLKPHSPLSVEIHSDIVILEQTTATSDGSLSLNLPLPPGMTEGYHTLHVLGEDIRGTLVDYYQAFYVTTTHANTPLIVGEAPIIQGTPAQHNEVAGEVLPTHIDRTAAIGQKLSKPSGVNLIPLLYLTIGIMAVWLILVLLLRNLFLKNFFTKLNRRVIFWKRSQ